MKRLAELMTLAQVVEETGLPESTVRAIIKRGRRDGLVRRADVPSRLLIFRRDELERVFPTMRGGRYGVAS